MNQQENDFLLGLSSGSFLLGVKKDKHTEETFVYASSGDPLDWTPELIQVEGNDQDCMYMKKESAPGATVRAASGATVKVTGETTGEWRDIQCVNTNPDGEVSLICERRTGVYKHV